MNRMYIIVAAIVILSACEPERTPEMIRNEIAEHKEKITELNHTIIELEKELGEQGNKEVADNSLRVTVTKMAPAKFEHYFEATASVEAVNAAYISPETGGQIKQIHVSEGDRVSKGQLLVSLNSDILKNSIAELESGLELARTMYQKQKDLWDKKIGSEVQYLQAKNQKESLELKLETLNSQLELTKIKAPFAGIIDNINKKIGELASPGMPLMQLVNLKQMYINTDMSETYISSISEGNAVTVSFPSIPDLTIETEISRMGQVIQPKNRTFEVQVKVDNKEERIKPNVMAVIKMKDYEKADALQLPSIILQNDITGTYCFVAKTVNGKTTAKKRYLKTGRSNNTHTIITDGLSAGDDVITQGYNLVKDGTPVSF